MSQQRCQSMWLWFGQRDKIKTSLHWLRINSMVSSSGTASQRCIQLSCWYICTGLHHHWTLYDGSSISRNELDRNHEQNSWTSWNADSKLVALGIQNGLNYQLQFSRKEKEIVVWSDSRCLHVSCVALGVNAFLFIKKKTFSIRNTQALIFSKSSFCWWKSFRS